MGSTLFSYPQKLLILSTLRLKLNEKSKGESTVEIGEKGWLDNFSTGQEKGLNSPHYEHKK